MNARKNHIVMTALVFLFAVILSSCDGMEWTTNVFARTVADDTKRLLMIGNSYTFRNSLRNTIDGMVKEAYESTASTETFEYSRGGYTLSKHVKDALSSPNDESNPPLIRTLLVTDPLPLAWVVLQEQSQTGGLVEIEIPYFRDSRQAATELNDLIVATASNTSSISSVAPTVPDTIFFMTWGGRNGDPLNPFIYPDFLTMTNKLVHGYERYVDATSTTERSTVVAPVGLAFQRVYEATNDPMIVGSDFYNLYMSDGVHPSEQGSYLAACVLFVTLTGLDPQGLIYTPPNQSLDDLATRTRLQSIAYDTMLEYHSDWYPLSASTNAPVAVHTTKTPTPLPTNSPRFLPTATPSLQRSQTPTGRLSTQPTINSISSRPSGVPTVERTLVPTSVEPSNSPKLTMKPTLRPSARPSMIPSVTLAIVDISENDDSVNPSASPSDTPIVLLTVQPTEEPSAEVLGRPVGNVFDHGSPQPSSGLLSRSPSGVPSNSLTGSPTREPYGRPSGYPIEDPSIFLVDKPSDAPIRMVVQSTRPSNEFSSIPSEIQTSDYPSHVPSIAPSEFSSGKPVSSVPTTSSVPSQMDSGSSAPATASSGTDNNVFPIFQWLFLSPFRWFVSLMESLWSMM